MLLADSDRGHRRARGERGRQAVDIAVSCSPHRERRDCLQALETGGFAAHDGHLATRFTRAMIGYVVPRLDLEAAAADSRELQGSDHSDEPICRVRFFQVDSEHIFMQILPISNPGVKAYSFTFG